MQSKSLGLVGITFVCAKCYFYPIVLVSHPFRPPALIVKVTLPTHVYYAGARLQNPMYMLQEFGSGTSANVLSTGQTIAICTNDVTCHVSNDVDLAKRPCF